MESDLAWAPTHTLTSPFTEVVDHSVATSILAAGKGSTLGALTMLTQDRSSSDCAGKKRDHPATRLVRTPSGSIRNPAVGFTTNALVHLERSDRRRSEPAHRLRRPPL